VEAGRSRGRKLSTAKREKAIVAMDQVAEDGRIVEDG